VTTGGHVVAIGGAGLESAPILRHILSLARAERPRVTFLGTATGDAREPIVRFYEAFGRLGCGVAHVELFGTPVRSEVRERLLASDVVYVGGGNTANLLALWRLHGVDVALREGWERGAVLCGTSAGANCWFEACTTDSFGPLAPLVDGLGLLPGSFCPHYDGEPDRRPTYLRLVAGGFPGGYAVDDGAALHFRGRELAEAIGARPHARAYRVEAREGAAVESPLEVRSLS
jgi:dipeptidase E